MVQLSEILALPEELRAQRNTQAIADALSEGRTKLVCTEVGNGLILNTIGLTSGNALLDAIGGNTNFKYVKPLLEQGRLDVSSALGQGALDGYAQAAVITQAEADALKALGQVADPVSEYEVRCLCWSDDGQWLV